MITVYWALPEHVSADLAAGLRTLLDADERARADHLHVAEDRHAFVIAHALLRLALHAEDAPGNTPWTLTRAPDGKPVVGTPNGAHPRYVTLSHVRTCVACAVSPASGIGIDVERTGRVPLDDALLRASCTADERELLRSCAPDERDRAFARIWTRKEARFKAGPADVARIVTLEPDALHVISIAGGPAADQLDVRQFDEDALWRARHNVRTA